MPQNTKQFPKQRGITMNNNKKKVNSKRIKVKELNSFEVIRPNTAGIDIGSDQHWVSVPPTNSEQDVRKFGAFTCDLYQIASWLKKCNIEYVAMEATGIYWIPLFQVLEEKGFNVSLINARHIKIVDARKKSDRLDCEWIRRLHACGLLTPSFRPEPEICKIRSLLRHRDNLIKMKTRHIQHMQKSLELMSIKLSNVISDITGVTGLAIIKKILDNERDVYKLAALRDRRIKSSQEDIAKSLQGHYREEHLCTLQLALDALEFTNKQIKQLDRKVEHFLACLCGDLESQQLIFDFDDDQPIREKKRKIKTNNVDYDLDYYLQKITHTDLTSVTGIKDSALTIVSEIGLDMTKWPSAKHFSSWIGLAPQPKISGGKVLSHRTPKVKSRVAHLFRNAASTLRNSDCYLGTFYRHIRKRKGPACAVTATARKLSVIVYHMLKNQSPYRELGSDYILKQRERNVIKNAKRQLKALGYSVTLTKNN